MKQLKFYSVVTFIMAVVIYTQHAVATPIEAQPARLYLSPAAAVQPDDDGQEDPDGGDDQCELKWPFCEANLD